MIQLDGYFCIYLSDRLQTGLEKKYQFHEPCGTMVHMMHVLFVLFTVFENLKASFL